MTQAINLIKKNARVVVLIAVAIVLVAVAFVFYSSSQSASDEKATVQTQLTAARTSLATAQSQYDVTKLQAQKDSLTSSPNFPATFPTVELSAYLAAAADKYAVEINVVSPKSPASTQTIGGKKYFEYDTVVQVSGAYDAMDSFVNYLEHGQQGPFPSLSIKNATFTPSSGSLTVAILALS
jgi:type II secretory pathway pseudopilin PulG